MPLLPDEDPTTQPRLLTTPGSPPRAELQPRLVQLGGARGEVGRVLLLDRDEVVIGRQREGVHLSVNDTGVSRRHAAIQREADGFRVVDFDSRNGTFVNNVRVKTADLKDGDRIQLGATTLLRFGRSATPDEWLHQSIDQGKVALWGCDIACNLTTWSEQADQVLHLPAGTLSKRSLPFASLLHPDEATRVIGALQRAVEQGHVFEEQFRLMIGPEFSRWVACRAHLLRNGKGQPERLTGTVVDVSHQKRRELDLRRMAMMFESLSDGVFLADESGALVDLNSGAQRLFKLTKVETLGKRLFSLIGAPNDEQLALEARTALATAERWAVELTLPDPGGERSFEVAAFPLKNEDEVLGAAFLFRNITERKKLESQVAFYDRLSALGTLSAGIAHEINNPLSFVLGSLEFVRSQLSEKGEGFHLELEALDDGVAGARRIANTIKDMKVFSRDDASPRPVPTDPRPALELALKMAQKLMSSSASITQELADGLPTVSATESRLSQVFLNLLVNAAQAIPSEKRGHITVRQFLEGDFVVTQVSDDGVGIPPENLKRVFDPFFTTKPVGVGTGLGLSICHGLVAGFKGALSVASEPGKGTTFTVKLAVTHEPISLPPPAPQRNQRKGRILLVDDEPQVLRALARVLSDVHEVTIAGSTDEALTRLEHEDFDVIFCDVMMPDRTGIDFYEQLDLERPELARRVVFVSGGAFTERSQRFLAQVSNTMLTKPIDAAELSNVVQALLREGTGATSI